MTATASYLQAEHPGAGVFVLSDGDPGEDLGSVRIVDVDDADVVVLGGGCDDFSYDAMNRVFRRVNEGAAFVAMHRNLYWRTADGLQLDGGAFVAALEAATGVTPVVCGKPSAAYFASALAMLGGAGRARGDGGRRRRERRRGRAGRRPRRGAGAHRQVPAGRPRSRRARRGGRFPRRRARRCWVSRGES